MPYRNDKASYSLDIASRLAGVSKYSIRQYVDKGLLIPFKTHTGRNLYSDADIERLKHIRIELAENGLNVAGIKRLFAQTPCWLLKPCNREDFKSCPAYVNTRQPCWLEPNRGMDCRKEDCRSCIVYRSMTVGDDIRDLFKKFEKRFSEDTPGEIPVTNA